MGQNQYGSYDAEVLTATGADAGLTPTAYDATTGDKFTFTARRPMWVMGLGCEVTTAYTVPGTAQVVALDFRPTHNSDTGRLEKATITMNAARADGTIIHKRIDGFKVLPGQQVIIKQKTAGATGAGAANWFILACPVPESDGNCANLVVL
jgi:hypothetical protein